MSAIIFNAQIASGHNNTAGLTLVTSLQDANNVNFVKVRGWPFRRRGQRIVRGDGTTAFVGYESVQWVSSGMTIAQYAYVLANLEGLVTIKHPLTSVSYTNYNAILTMPDERDMEWGDFASKNGVSDFTGPGYRDVVWNFTRVEAI